MSPPSRPPARRASETRVHILESVWALVAERGVEVSMQEVADHVGLTRQSIYLHFGSRGGLLMALVRHADERAGIRERLAATFEIEDPRRRLDAFLGVWLEFVPGVHPVARSLWRQREHDAAAAEAWRDRTDDLVKGIRRLTASLERDGALRRPWTAARAADFLWAYSSMQLWELLAIERGWGAHEASRVIRHTIAETLLVEPQHPTSSR